MLFAPVVDLKKDKGHVRMSAEKVQQRLAVGEDPARSDFWTYVLRYKEGEMESPSRHRNYLHCLVRNDLLAFEAGPRVG